jgi:2-hydroxychromene-2-carboxylate isomerase
VTPDQPVFYYDLGDPECYLVAERVISEMAVVPEWEPVLARSLGIAFSPDEPVGLRERVSEHELQPLRWPSPWPPDTELAMLAATYAKHIGRAVAFSLAAFRQAFAGGRDLSEEGTVLIAAAACEMHPTAVMKGVGLRSVKAGLSGAAERAREARVDALPAISVAGELFSGPGCLNGAVAMLGQLEASR